MPDIFSFGDILIDFTPVVIPGRDNALLQINPGGSAANVAVQAAKCGCDSIFCGKVGKDRFGEVLKKTLNDNGVVTDSLVLDPCADTTLAFVTLDEHGDRSFTFFRRGSADTRLMFSEVDLKALDTCKAVHSSSLPFTDNPARETALKILEYSKSHNKIISYDPNWRPLLWSSEEFGVSSMKLGLEFCDVIKVSLEELQLLTGCVGIHEGIDGLLARGIGLIALTLGADGCVIANEGNRVHLPTYDVKAVDTTGSGDAFLGACLCKIIEIGKTLCDLTIEELLQIGTFANAAGAMCASKLGAIAGMADRNEILKCIDSIPLLSTKINLET